MSSISMAELLIILTVVIFIVIAIKLLGKVSKTEAGVSKWIEKRQTRKASFVTQETPSLKPKIWWIPLPYALLVPLLVYATVITLVRLGWASPSSARYIDIFLTGLSIAFVIAGVVVHFNPRSSRRTKYELLVSGTTMLAMNIWLRFLGRYTAGTIILVEPILVLLFGLAFSLWMRPWKVTDRPQLPSKLMRRMYRSVMVCGYFLALTSISGLVQLILNKYLVFRYLLVAKMSERPILYLRSFSYSEGPSAFGKVVVRVASRYGVVIALAHETQSSLVLHEKTRLTERARLFNAPDENWQSWVDRELTRCSVVIIDRSIETEGVSWELNRALELLPSYRILVLQKKGTTTEDLGKVWSLDYELGQVGEREARETLEARLQKIFYDLAVSE